VNPPRKGCEAIFLEKLAAHKPKKVVYISCDPATLARDCAYLCEKGYQVKKVRPFDMFPQTAHVETLTLLEML
jgi:23S rRNA (uracil1939-C5)-methyltransferase